MIKIIWFIILALLTFIAFRSARKAAANRRQRIGKRLLLFVVAFLWLSQFLKWTVNSGNLLHESLHFPNHVVEVLLSPTDGMKTYKYSYGEHRRQYFYVFQPEENELLADKVIYYLHGGGWQVGSPEFYRPAAKYFVDQGYTVVMPAYRLIPRFNYTHIREDLTNGLGKALSVLEEMGLGKKKIILIGDSAGGNLVAHILYNKDELEKINTSQDRFAGLISIAGILNVDEFEIAPIRNAFTGTKNELESLDANPFHLVEQGEQTPLYCIHGTKDGIVNYACTKTFVEKVNQKSPNLATLLTISEGTHLSVVGEWLYTQNTVRDMIEQWLIEIDNS